MSYYKYYFSTDTIPGSDERIRAKNELIYSLLAPCLEPGASVLELGTGKGYFARLCAGRGHSYHGIEADEGQCRALMEEGFEMTCSRLPPLPDTGDGFGLVYSAHLLEHMPDSHAVHELLAGCARAAADDGVVAMLFPDALAMGREFWNCDYTHLYPTTERRVAQAARDAGLEVSAGCRLNGHYTGVKRLLAQAGSHHLFLKAAGVAARRQDRRELFYRGWMYLQRDILLIMKPRLENMEPQGNDVKPRRDHTG